MMTPKELAALKELHECQDTVNDTEYKPAERLILKQLRAKRLVALSWVLLPAGLKALEESTDV